MASTGRAQARRSPDRRWSRRPGEPPAPRCTHRPRSGSARTQPARRPSRACQHRSAQPAGRAPATTSAASSQACS
ncbi:MAG: hypothetical protein CVT65_14475 [Actinobacteria bacterium HGW-Actinobacteria-5]|nr:MAG: hypothetical protein CVT65_14475 [Actinobacteria bacterium HGW-Actinobacteria-5]